MNRFLSGLLTVPLIAAQGLLNVRPPELSVGVTVIAHGGASDYILVRPSDSPFAVTAAATTLSRSVKKETGVVLSQYTDESLPKDKSSVKKQKFIRIGFPEDEDALSVSLAFRDFAVFTDDGDLCVTAGNEKAYADAIEFIAEEYLRDGSFIVPNTPYVFHDTYRFENRTFFGTPLSDCALLYENAAGKALCNELSALIRENCGRAPHVSEAHNASSTADTYIRFGAGTGLSKAEYRITAENGGILLTSPTGEGLRAAYDLMCETLFSDSAKESLEKMNITGKLEKTAVYEKDIAYRAPLANTLYRLEKDKELRVAYFGGSVTVGYGASDTEKYSWRARTTAWLKEAFPDADITEINAAIGATGSYLGSFRTERDIVSQKPDLLFVEFAINDVYNGETIKSAELHYESIVRQVRKALPFCDIVAVFTTDSGRTASGGDYMQQKGHDAIAKLYDIPSVNIGRALTRSKNLSGAVNDEWKKYFTDIVNMTLEGYGEYASVIKEFLRNELLFSSGALLSEHTISAAKYAEADVSPRYEVASKDHLKGANGWRFDEGSFQNLPLTPYKGFLYTNEKENALTYTFEGTELALFLGDYTAGTIRYSVDGGEEKSASRNSMNNPFVLAKELPNGKHTVTLSVVFSDKTSSSCRIGAFLPRVQVD